MAMGEGWVTNGGHEVIIVGAGPTGLALANPLGTYGVRTLVLERNGTTVGEPGAASIDDESLQTLQVAGLADTAIIRIMLDYGSRYVGPSGRSFASARLTTREFGYPRRSAFHQAVLERQLAEELERFPHVDVRLASTRSRFIPMPISSRPMLLPPQNGA